MSKQNMIAFQGRPGAFSDVACRSMFPTMETLPCLSFEDTFEAVRNRKAELAMIPIENSTTGRVADIHHLLPRGGLYIIGEHYQKIHHHLLVLPGVGIGQVRRVRSHIQALEQCRGTLHRLGVEVQSHSDTAGAAAQVARLGKTEEAAIASELAAQIYNLDVVLSRIEDKSHNTTRFLILKRTYEIPTDKTTPSITSLFFQVRSVPAALFKALGGFATNGINLTKLESYIIDERFTAAQFYVEVESHAEADKFLLSLEELHFFAQDIKILGCYPMHTFRNPIAQNT